MVVECDTSIAINYCYFAQLQQRAVNSQLLEGSMKPSRVEHNVFTVRHQFALKSLDDQRRSLCVPQCPPMYDQEDIADPDEHGENGTRLCRLNETSQFNSSWYSWWRSPGIPTMSAWPMENPNDKDQGFHSSPAQTNEEFVANWNRRKRNSVSYKQWLLINKLQNEKGRECER